MKPKEDPVDIVQLELNKKQINKNGKWNINATQAKEILNTYGIKHMAGKSYSKSINRTGIDINYDVNTNLFSLSRKS